MKDPRSALIQQQAREASQRNQSEALQRAKLEALQQALGNYGVYTYLDLNDLIDPNNKNWTELTYRLPSFMVSPTENAERHGHIGFDKPAAHFINNIRNAKTIGDVYKQSELWDSYDPLSSRDNTRKYLMYMIGGSQPESPTTNEPNPAQITAGDTAGGAQGAQGAQGVQGVQGVQAGTQGVQAGAQAGAKPGNAVAGGGVQGSNSKPGKKPRMSDAEIDAFLNEELGGDTTGNGTYASAGVSRGGTKTIGYKYDPNPNNVALAYEYDPNPGNISLAYAMRNAPEQERRAALINEWNKEHGISYVTGKDGLIYRTDPQHPNGYVDPFKNDLSKISSTGYATGQGMLTSGSNGTYATGEGIKDAYMGKGFEYGLTYDPKTSSMRPIGNVAYRGKGFDSLLTYDPMSNSMRPIGNIAPSGGDGTDLTLTYDPMTSQLVRR